MAAIQGPRSLSAPHKSISVCLSRLDGRARGHQGSVATIPVHPWCLSQVGDLICSGHGASRSRWGRIGCSGPCPAPHGKDNCQGAPKTHPAAFLRSQMLDHAVSVEGHGGSEGCFSGTQMPWLWSREPPCHPGQPRCRAKAPECRQDAELGSESAEAEGRRAQLGCGWVAGRRANPPCRTGKTAAWDWPLGTILPALPCPEQGTEAAHTRRGKHLPQVTRGQDPRLPGSLHSALHGRLSTLAGPCWDADQLYAGGSAHLPGGRAAQRQCHSVDGAGHPGVR